MPADSEWLQVMEGLHRQISHLNLEGLNIQKTVQQLDKRWSWSSLFLVLTV